jgi:hypothetical protein
LIVQIVPISLNVTTPADLPDHAMPPILASTAVLKKLAGNVRQAKGMVKLPVSEQPSV